MGLYTTLKLQVTLSDATPTAMLDLLRKGRPEPELTENGFEVPQVSPEVSEQLRHPFFESSRCGSFLGKNGAPGEGEYLTLSQTDNGWELALEVRVKYGFAIDDFLDWIAPHVLTRGKCGTSKLENEEENLVYFDGAFNEYAPWQLNYLKL